MKIMTVDGVRPSLSAALLGISGGTMFIDDPVGCDVVLLQPKADTFDVVPFHYTPNPPDLSSLLRHHEPKPFTLADAMQALRTYKDLKGVGALEIEHPLLTMKLPEGQAHPDTFRRGRSHMAQFIYGRRKRR